MNFRQLIYIMNNLSIEIGLINKEYSLKLSQGDLSSLAH